MDNEAKERQLHINKIYKADLANKPCPHCGLFSLIREGKDWHCIQCERDFGPTGRRFISEKRELERGCYPNGKVHNRNHSGVGANSDTRLGRS